MKVTLYRMIFITIRVVDYKKTAIDEKRTESLTQVLQVFRNFTRNIRMSSIARDKFRRSKFYYTLSGKDKLQD